MVKTVLTVDDSKVLRMIVNRHLKPFGVETLEAENGEIGLTRARENKPDLILLDYNMPVMDGYRTLERLKADAVVRTIPVIMLTTEAGTETVVKLIKLGLKDYIAKPFSREDLLTKLNALLHLYEGDVVPPEYTGGVATTQAAIKQSGRVKPASTYKYLSISKSAYILRFPSEQVPGADVFANALDSEILTEVETMVQEGCNRIVLELSPLFMSSLLIAKKFSLFMKRLKELGVIIKAVTTAEKVKEVFLQNPQRKHIEIFSAVEEALAAFS